MRQIGRRASPSVKLGEAPRIFPAAASALHDDEQTEPNRIERSRASIFQHEDRDPHPSIVRSTVLPRNFYNRDPRDVSRDLLGKVLVRRERKKTLAARIVEVEAYLGEDDPAAHSAAGRTLRNAVLFGPPGYAYVYFIYGNYYCLNVSCLPDGIAGGILFRALEPLDGIKEMAGSRGVTVNDARDLRKLTTGPGRLAEAFGITRKRDNGKDLTDPKSDLFIADDGYRIDGLVATYRIGITKAAELPLRYIVPTSNFLSGPKKLQIGQQNIIDQAGGSNRSSHGG